MKTPLRYILLAILFYSADPLFGQVFQPAMPFGFNADVAKFRYDDSSSYYEIFYAFYPQVLTFSKLPSGDIRAVIKVNTKITDENSGTMVANDVSYIPVVIRDTSDEAYTQTLVAKLAYRLGIGTFRLEITAADSMNERSAQTIPFTLNVALERSVPFFSGIVLASSIVPTEDKESPFYKNGLEVRAQPSLLFGAVTSPSLWYYCEIYNLTPEKEYRIEAYMLTARGDTAKKVVYDRKFTRPNIVERNRILVSSLLSGRHILRMNLRDKGDSLLASAEKTFFLYNPHIQPTQEMLLSAKSAEYAGMSYEELEREFQRAKYISSEKDIQTFQRMNSIEGRREFLAAFWLENEKGRLGRAPITRSEYFQRVETANKRYRMMSREGWQSDRGRILIMYGEPDDIERYPSQEETKPYEIWFFNSIENGVQFVFVDRTGFGEFTLVHSTKRGELLDDTWQRFLY